MMMSTSSFFSCESLVDEKVPSPSSSPLLPIQSRRPISSMSDSETDTLSIRTSIVSLTSRRCQSQDACFECVEMDSLCDRHRNSCTSSIRTDRRTLSSNRPNLKAGVQRRPCSYRQQGCGTVRQLSMYDNTDETQAEFLSASQIQSIMNVHKFADLQKPHYERCSPGQPHIFGCNVNCLELHNSGRLLPVFIENTLIYLLKHGLNCVGIFRKSGVKSRIVFLRKRLEQVFGEKSVSTLPSDHPTTTTTTTTTSRITGGGRRNSSFNPYDDDDCCVYDLADLIKCWLRELKPIPLISKQLIDVFIRLKAEGRLNQLSYYIIAYLTDPQRDILLIFLRFFGQFARNAHQNQMNAHNLAICLAPSICEYSALLPTGSGGKSFESQSQTLNLTLKKQSNIDRNLQSSASSTQNGSMMTMMMPKSPSLSSKMANIQHFAMNEAETLVNAQHCLEYLICNHERILMLSPAIVHSSAERLLTGSVSYQLLNDGNLLPPAHQLKIDIPAPPVNILNRILYQRNLFDSTIIEWRIVESNEQRREDVLEYKTQKSHFLPSKNFRVRRNWIFCELPDEGNSSLSSPSSSSTRSSPGSSSTSTSTSSSSSSSCQKSNCSFASTSGLSPLFDSTSTFYDSSMITTVRPLSGSINQSAPFKLLEEGRCKDHSVLLREEGTLYNVTYAIRSLANKQKGHSQLTASVAIDLKGRSFYWYKNIFPDLISGQLQTLRRTFVLDCA